MSFRRDFITRPIFSLARGALPPMSDTEREALEAGDVWWDADLFTGNPDWAKLLANAPATLTDEEKAFLHGPVDELCAMLDDWKINWEWRDLPPEAWDFIKRHKFFGMIIPKEFGGLGFSPYAHSEVVRKLSSRSLAAAVTVMVPNSLGPGELLMRFGTKEQQDRWLPRLADGRDIPCFGLTSPEAGSDAASMIDKGVVCKGMFEGREVIGLKLNWHKRYITLGPVATLLGLAFKAYDPDHLVGSEEDLGISVALIPTHLPGVEIGRRHLPAMQVFQNGPNWGRDVFLPIDHIIGGAERHDLGELVRMLRSEEAREGVEAPSRGLDHELDLRVHRDLVLPPDRRADQVTPRDEDPEEVAPGLARVEALSDRERDLVQPEQILDDRGILDHLHHSCPIATTIVPITRLRRRMDG